MNESKLLPSLIDDIYKQTYKKFQIIACVNQLDDWWENNDKIAICLDNQFVINYLNTLNQSNIHIIDKSSRGNGWKGKNFGVGWARKTAMDYSTSLASDNDIIVSIDADTRINKGYFQSIINTFDKHHNSIAISVPYFHKLTENNLLNRCLLRYEIYMRYYSINLWRTNIPYHFTALGSAICLKVLTYKKIGGITPKKSGEDFYFIQKLVKTGEVLNWNPEKVYPETRFSNRVFFGTGPALIKGSKGDWKSYPIYHFSLFDKVYNLYEIFNKIFTDNIYDNDLKLLKEFSIDKSWWMSLKKNFRTETHFIKACYGKFDALRILQFLKSNHSKIVKTDEECLIEFILNFHNEKFNFYNFKNFSFETSSIDFLDNIRNKLMMIEEDFQKNEFKNTETINEK